MRALFILFVLAVLVIPANAQICWTCKVGSAEFSPSHECMQGPHQMDGHTDCTVGYLFGDSYCDFGGNLCSSYNPTCRDENNNFVCDKDELVGSCGPNDPLDQCASPILVQLAPGPWRFSGRADAVMFDIDGDGDLELITWPAPGSRLAFLFFDRNRNGIVDSGRELFGNAYMPKVHNGFAVLSMFDAAPYNNMVEESDPQWRNLRLWEDVNHDGQSQPEEITTLDAAGITAFGLDYDVTPKKDREGTQLRLRGDLWMGQQKRHFYDVYFVRFE